MLSLPIAVAFLLVYERSCRNNRLLMLLPVLQILWINIHGGTALLGWALAGGFLAERAWRGRRNGSWPAFKTISWEAAAFGGVVIASFINPNSVEALTYGLLRTKSPLQIDEFHSFRESVQAGFMIRATIFLAWTALLGLFQMSCQMGSFSRVIDYLQTYLTLHPADTAVMFCLATLYQREKLYDRARQLLQDILLLEPAHQDARNLLEETQNSLNLPQMGKETR